MSTKLTILVVSLDAVGHMNACTGICQKLVERGHKVVFAVADTWKNKLAPFGFIEEWYTPDVVDEESNKMQILTEMASKMAPCFQQSLEEQITSVYLTFFGEFMVQAKKYEPRLKEIIAKVKPDVILADLLVHQPAVMDAGIPWVLQMSVAPMGISTKNLPPPLLGLCTDRTKDVEAKKRCAELFKSVMHDTTEDYKKWVLENGGPTLKHMDPPFMLKYSPYANMYMYPEELDYTNLRPNPPNFHRFDTFVRTSNETFEIPEILKHKPGKLIYFSMGTIGCSELGMLKRLVSIFAKSPHRFIVSKGPRADELELAENMWGKASLPQVKVIPLVDLVITHGGNNTFTESFYFGKPVLVLPLFGDQLDNAQRVLETGLGLRLHPYEASEREFLAAIEKLLNDEEIRIKMSNISKRIQASNGQSRAADIVEKVASMRLPTAK